MPDSTVRPAGLTLTAIFAIALTSAPFLLAQPPAEDSAAPAQSDASSPPPVNGSNSYRSLFETLKEGGPMMASPIRLFVYYAGVNTLEFLPIPPIEHRRLHVVRMRQKVLLPHGKKVPVVRPLRGNFLKLLKTCAVPFVNLRGHIVQSSHDNSLSNSQKMAIPNSKVAPLFGGNCRNTLEFLKTVSTPFVDD